MRLALYRLTFHENLFYATREAGRLYETGRYLHNYALAYALGLAAAPYYQAQQVPRYAEELQPLNQQGIYVTPARGVQVRYELNTFKFADNAYHVQMTPGSRNLPSFGRAKEIAVGSQFEFAVLSPAPLAIPRWVRMGLWRSKAMVECLGEVEARSLAQEVRVAGLPINPLDTPGSLQVFDLISMPPSSLAENARINTAWWSAEVAGRALHLPAGMQFRFTLG